jgi:hypothetical protein
MPPTLLLSPQFRTDAPSAHFVILLCGRPNRGFMLNEGKADVLPNEAVIASEGRHETARAEMIEVRTIKTEPNLTMFGVVARGVKQRLTVRHGFGFNFEVGSFLARRADEIANYKPRSLNPGWSSERRPRGQ